MSGIEIGITGFVALLVLLALRIPIAIAMLGVGLVGYTVIAGTVPLLSFLKGEVYWQFTSETLSVVNCQ